MLEHSLIGHYAAGNHLLGVEEGVVAVAGVEAEVGAVNRQMCLNWLLKERASWALGWAQGWSAGWSRLGPV